MDWIDFRSDTVTQPSVAMREAMARAEVGDDVYGEDPSVNRLQEVVTARLGKEAALFVPSGTMANQLCIRAQTEPGDEIIVEAGGHSFNFETGATAALSGVQVQTIAGEHGIFDGDALRAAIRPDMIAFAHTALVCLENTHNAGGGTVWPLAKMRAVADLARSAGLAVHLDGARLFNAAAASRVDVAEYAALADTVSVCLSKGLGAPVGSVVAASTALVARMRRLRKQLGGGMRQAGILAAAGIYALENNVTRLGEDHANARALQGGMVGLPWVDGFETAPQTNIVMVRLKKRVDPSRLLEQMRAGGVLAHEFGPRHVRFVTHLDVSAADIKEGLMRLQGVTEGLP